MAAAEQARVQLRPRKARVFDEVVDIVNFDLVLVLDHFDLTEVCLSARVSVPVYKRTTCTKLYVTFTYSRSFTHVTLLKCTFEQSRNVSR